MLRGRFAQAVQELRHILGQRGRKTQPRAADGVNESQARGMQRLAAEGVEVGGKRLAHALLGAGDQSCDGPVAS